jgi:hypothetical protein
MRLLQSIIFFFLWLTFSQAFAQGRSVDLEAVRALIGAEVRNAGIAFLGDDVKPFLDGTQKGFSSWGKFKRKTDVFVVFSEETKTVVQRKTRKRVVVGDSIGAFFTRSWRGQDFLTWIDIQGEKVAFVETSGRPGDSNVRRVQADSDRRLAEFVTEVSEKKGKVKVLLVGTKVDQAFLDTNDLSDQFKKLDRMLSYLIVPTDKMKEAFSKITTKKIYVNQAEPEQGEEKSVTDRMRWMIVEAKGSDLVRVLGSGNLNSILKPR